MKIDQEREPGYESVSIGEVGFVDPYALEGVAILRADDGREFPLRAFSGEVARHITRFRDGDYRRRRGGDVGDSLSRRPRQGQEVGQGQEELPTVYKMIEEICGHGGMFLAKVKIYESGGALRANLYLAGKKSEMVLRNYRASDALALAAYCSAPILVRTSLLDGQVADAR